MRWAGELCRVMVERISFGFGLLSLSAWCYFKKLQSLEKLHFSMLYWFRYLTMKSFLSEVCMTKGHVEDFGWDISFSGLQGFHREVLLWFLVHSKFSPNGNHYGLRRETQMLVEMLPSSYHTKDNGAFPPGIIKLQPYSRHLVGAKNCLGMLFVFSHLNLTSRIQGGCHYYYVKFTNEKTGIGSLRNLPNSTQLVRLKTGFEPRQMAP